MTPERLIDRIFELNLRAVEWCHFPCHEPGKVDWDQVKLLHQLGQKNGITSSVAGFAPLLAEADGRENMLAMVQTQVAVSKFIASKRMRFHGMVEVDLGIGVQAPREVCLENLKYVVELAEKHDIVIALENHMDFSTDDFRFFFDRIDSPFLKINLDTGNHLPLMEDVEAFTNEFCDKIVSCHLKAVGFVWRDYGAVLTSCIPQHSLVDLTRILNILSSGKQDIVVHIEVVAMDSKDEDYLVGEQAEFLLNYLNNGASDIPC